MNGVGPAQEAVQVAIDREVGLVDSAIDLVAGGGAVTATVAGLRLAEAVIEIVRPHAAERGVQVEILWTSVEASADIRVSRNDPR